MRRRFILMSCDTQVDADVRAALPDKWEVSTVAALDAIGGFEEIVQYRYMLLDLDEAEAFDPLEILREVRVDLMLNLPDFCFGGTPALRDAARLARADRFLGRDEVTRRMPEFSPNSHGARADPRRRDFCAERQLSGSAITP